jgi:peroxiredoxin
MPTTQGGGFKVYNKIINMKKQFSFTGIKRLFALLVFTFLFTSSFGQKNTIQGTLQLKQPVEGITLGYEVAGEHKREETKLINGKFSFSRELTEPTWGMFVVTYAPTETGKRGTIERFPIYIEPGVMTVDAKDSLKFAVVSGSESHKVYQEYLNQRLPYTNKIKSLRDQLKILDREKDEEGMRKIRAEMTKLSEDVRQKFLVDYLTNNPKSPIAMYVLWYYFNNEMDDAKAEFLFNGLDSKLQMGENGVFFKKGIDAIKNTEIGALAMNFTQNDTLNRPVSLASFRGKYVLLDFWASWCGPCRAENPNLVKNFNTYKDRNFTVLSVSLDQPGKKQAWLDAIHKDGLISWTHVSDLKSWNNEVAKLYGIHAVPQNFLIDPKGKIIAKNIKGEALTEKLAELFN